MKHLLDTHAFLWANSGDQRLSTAAAEAFIEAELLLSTASIWEIVTKYQIGRLDRPAPPSEFLPQHLERNGIALSAILPRHVPFDWNGSRITTRTRLTAYSLLKQLRRGCRF